MEVTRNYCDLCKKEIKGNYLIINKYVTYRGWWCDGTDNRIQFAADVCNECDKKIADTMRGLKKG